MANLVNLSLSSRYFTGSSSGNTTFVGTLGGSSPTVKASDVVTGQGGGNVFDLNVFGVNTIPALQVSGVQTLNITSDSNTYFNDQSWSGLKSVSFNVYGGDENVSISTQASSLAVSAANYDGIQLFGGAQTHSISVTGGIYNEIIDNSPNTLQTISINSAGVPGLYSYTQIESTDLTNLNITNTATGVYVDSDIPSASPVLNLTLNGDGPGYVGSTGAFFEDNGVGLLTVLTEGAPSSIYLQMNAATEVDFVDAQDLYVTEFVDESAKKITIAGSGAFSADFEIASASASIDASGATGAITVELASAGQQSFKGGYGQDIVTIGGTQTGQVIGGKSSLNEIILADAGVASNASLANVKNFTELGIAGTTSGSFDLQKAGMSAVDIQGAGGALTFSVVTGTDIHVDNSDSSSISVTRASALTMELGTATTTGIAVSSVNLSGAVVLNLLSNGAGVNTLGTLTGSTLAQVNLSGSAGVNLTVLSTNGIQIAGAADNADNTIVLQTPKGSAASAHNISLGNGADTVIDYGTATTIIHVGSGSDAITTAAGVTGTISLGVHSGADAITLGASGTSTTAIVSITGLNNAGLDTIQFADAASGHVTTVTATDVAHAGENANLLSNWIATVLGYHGAVAQTAHGLLDFQFQGDTYLVETASATDNGVLSSADTIVKLTGTGYSFGASSASDGILHLFG